MKRLSHGVLLFELDIQLDLEAHFFYQRRRKPIVQYRLWAVQLVCEEQSLRYEQARINTVLAKDAHRHTSTSGNLYLQNLHSSIGRSILSDARFSGHTKAFAGVPYCRLLFK